MNELTKYFYAFNPEDRQAQALQAAKKIDHNGRVLQQESDETLFELDDKEVQILHSAIAEERPAYSRYAHFLGKFSLIEVAKITNKAAESTLYLPKPQYILRGSLLRNLLKNRHIKIYKKWSGLPLTPLYETLLNCKNNDRDWVIVLKHTNNLNAVRYLVDFGLSMRMEQNLRAEKINPAFIVLNLTQAHIAAAAAPPNSYPSNVAKKQSKKISTTDTNLYKNYIELCGYRRAQDVNDKENKRAHSERVLVCAEKNIPDDYLFTNALPATATPINSLFVDLTSLLNNEGPTRLRLNSALGPAMRVQAVCDQVIGNLTRDPQQPVHYTDFAAAISHFTLGGRAYEVGGIDVNLAALKAEAVKRNMSWFELLGFQLISRVKHHHQEEAAVLIAMAYNASAILTWKHPELFDEIQELWKIIFGNADKLEKKESFPHVSSNPIIEHIQINMRDPQYWFSDLYAQLQISVAIEQNRLKIHKGAYQTYPTQTEGHVFHQIALPVELAAGSPHQIYLFFPYDLAISLKHLAFLHSSVYSRTTLNMLHILHETLIPSKDISFLIEGSPLTGHYLDPRRKSEQCFNESRKLMKLTNERAWKMGFLVACSLLSQKNSDRFITKITTDLIRLLLSRWPSDKFKKEMAAVFYQTLMNSGIFFDKNFFDELMQPVDRINYEQVFHIASACLKTDLAPFIAVASEFLSLISKQEMFLVDLYKKLGESCLSPNEIASHSLSFLVDSLNKQAHIWNSNKISLLCTFCEHPKGTKDHLLVRKIVEAIVSNLSAMIVCPADTQNRLLDIFQKNPASELMPGFFRELARLKIIANPETTQKLWETLMGSLSEKNEQQLYNDLSYLLSSAKKYHLWSWLTNEQRQAFIDKYSTITHSLYTQSGDLELIANLHVMENEDVHQTIHKRHIQSILEHIHGNDPLTEDKVEHLLEELRWVHCTWEETPVVAAVLESLSQIQLNAEGLRKLNAFLDNFQKIHDAQQPIELAAFWLEQLSQLDLTDPSGSAISLMILQFVLALASHEDHISQHSDDFFRRCAILLVKNADGWMLEISENLLKELHRRGMAKEILTLAVSGVIPYSEENLRLLSDLFILDNIEAIEPLLNQLPEWLIEDNQIQVKLLGIFKNVTKSTFKAGDFAKALNWLNQILMQNVQLDEYFYHLAFEIIRGSITKGQISEACRLVLSLPDRHDHAQAWFDICILLLDARQVSACVQLVHQSSSLAKAIKDTAHSQFQIKFLNKVKETILHLSLQSRKNRAEIHQACALMNRLVRSLEASDSSIWTEYIQILSHHGSLGQVEELLWYLLKDDKHTKLFPDAKNRMIKCWTPIFKRFKEEGSQALLTLIKSAKKTDNSDQVTYHIPILTEYLTTNQTEGLIKYDDSNVTFNSHVAGAILKALKLANRNDQKMLADIFYQGLNGDVLGTGLALSDKHQALLDIAEIALMGERSQTLCGAFYVAIAVLGNMKENIIAEEAAARLINRGVKLAMLIDDQELRKAVVTSIWVVQKSAYCDDGEHFIFLEYLHKFEDKEKMNNWLKGMKRKEIHIVDTRWMYFEEKMSSLKKIFQNPYTKRLYTHEQKKLVDKTINQLQYVFPYYIEEFRACQASPNLAWLASPASIKVINAVDIAYQKLPLDTIITTKCERYLTIVKKALLRATISHKFQQNHRFLRSEDQVLQLGVSWCRKAALVAVCAMAFFYILWRYNQPGSTHE